MNVGASFTVLVRGDPIAAWLTTCTLARFVLPRDAKIHIECSERLFGETLIIRPEMRRLHRSLGLDASATKGAVSVSGWRAKDHIIHLSELGKSLDGVAFHQLWARAKLLGHQSDLQSVARGQPVQDMFEIPSDAYLAALKSIARKAQIQCVEAPMKEPTLTIELVRAPTSSFWTETHIFAGSSVIPTTHPDALGLHALQTSLVSIVSNWQRGKKASPEQKHYTRSLSAAAETFREFENILRGDLDASPRLQHRVSCWREIGRVIPVDHDPFTEAEWVSALLNAGVEPTGFVRAADRIAEAKVLSFVEAQTSVGMQHV